jgi:hypothetical protein
VTTIHTPIPFVWATDGARQVWWNVELDRMVVQGLAPGYDRIIEMWEGGICVEHGVEGDVVGMADTLHDAWMWCAGGALPNASTVN